MSFSPSYIKNFGARESNGFIMVDLQVDGYPGYYDIIDRDQQLVVSVCTNMYSVESVLKQLVYEFTGSTDDWTLVNQLVAYPNMHMRLMFKAETDRYMKYLNLCHPEPSTAAVDLLQIMNDICGA